MGISAAIPILLQEQNVSMAQQGAFSFCSWPFSLKLLWAPVVDSWRTRKAWLVPTQFMIGGIMWYTSERVDTQFDPTTAPPPDVQWLTRL